MASQERIFAFYFLPSIMLEGKPVCAGTWAAMLRKLVAALNEGSAWRLSVLSCMNAEWILSKDEKSPQLDFMLFSYPAAF